jgi:hypothetical protein
MDRVVVVDELLTDEARAKRRVEAALKVFTDPQVQQVAWNESRAQAAQLLGIVVTWRREAVVEDLLTDNSGSIQTRSGS